MSDAVLCDRCGNATEKTEYKSGLRATLTVEHLSAAATISTSTDYQLCEPCTESLHRFLDATLPREYRERREYDNSDAPSIYLGDWVRCPECGCEEIDLPSFPHAGVNRYWECPDCGQEGYMAG